MFIILRRIYLLAAHSRTCRYELAYYNIFLESEERVRLALYSGFCQHSRRLLERRRRQERLGSQRSLCNTEQRSAVGSLGKSLFTGVYTLLYLRVGIGYFLVFVAYVLEQIG